MKEKSIYKKDELMCLPKEFLVDTILRLEKDKNHWLEQNQETLKEWKKSIDLIK
jgi:hypothetical protein